MPDFHAHTNSVTTWTTSVTSNHQLATKTSAALPGSESLLKYTQMNSRGLSFPRRQSCVILWGRVLIHLRLQAHFLFPPHLLIIDENSWAFNGKRV